MNIYVTDLVATEAAKNLCDKHIKEYPEKIVQICRNALATEETGGIHEEWCRTSKQNLEWMLEYGLTICNIYTWIFFKNNPFKNDLDKILKSLEKSKKFPKLGITRRPRNFPEKFCKLSYIEGNREHYKSKYLHETYSSHRIKPTWLK
jgi:hypothetical protein